MDRKNRTTARRRPDAPGILRWLASTAVAPALLTAQVAPAKAQDISGDLTGAQEPHNATIFRRHRAAADEALELQFSGGYQQAIGMLGPAPAPKIHDVAGVGIGGELAVGFRISPRWLVGAYGSGALYHAQQADSGVHSFAAGVQTQLHLRPFRSIDPWVGLGIGYRVFAFSAAGQGSAVHQAIQLPHFSLGVDFRPSPFVSFGPFFALDLSLFQHEPRPSPQAGTMTTAGSFVSAGLSGRFDLLGGRERFSSDAPKDATPAGGSAPAKTPKIAEP